MKQHEFEALHEERWRETEALTQRLERGASNPFSRGARAPELEGFPRLYRSLCRDLALAQERGYSPRLIERLNALALAGHRHLYSGDLDLRNQILRFFAQGFPERVRRDWRVVSLATALFLLPGLSLGLAVSQSPELIYTLLDAPNVVEIDSMYDPANRRIGTTRGSATDVQMFGYYIFNNIGIGFRAFASGIVLGLGSAFILVFNGLLLGGISARMLDLGFESTFFPFVIGHGAFELTAIVFAGAAGLKLGWAILAPGPLTRLRSLRLRARESIEIVYGATAMLFLAALVEAFWSSKAELPIEVKLGAGTLCWIAVAAYFLFAGRTRGSR